jgi:ubiquinone/menaquinone biosynthesis C-methylase UbiE
MSLSKKVEEWWADHPMTYAVVHGDTQYQDATTKPGTPEYFDRIDRQFFEWNTPLHGERPFSKIFPYDRFGKGAKVLEIGCGLGTMAMLWAQAGADVTAVDLNKTSIEQTQKRFDLKCLKGDIRQADARTLDFDTGRFDYAYSWGVLHHSSNLRQSLDEMMRVIKPGGEFGIMLYNRHSLLQWFDIDYKEGFLHFENRFLNRVELCSRYGDGGQQEGNPYTYPVTKAEMKTFLKPYARNVEVRVLGTDLDHILLWALPGIGKLVPKVIVKSWARRFGWSLWISGKKD